MKVAKLLAGRRARDRSKLNGLSAYSGKEGQVLLHSVDTVSDARYELPQATGRRIDGGIDPEYLF